MKIKKHLNEAIIGNCNMEKPEKEIETSGAVPEVYADAINQRKRRVKQIEDDFKESDKNIDEFVKDSSDNTVKGTADMKKMHLSEHLFEELTSTKLYKKAEEVADDLSDVLKAIRALDNTEDYIDEESIEYIVKAIDGLQDFAFAYSTIMDREDIFEATGTTVKKKRTRGPNEEKWGIDYSDTDLWLQIYDELDASLGNEGPGEQVNRFLKPKRGERYEYIYPHGQNDIIVGATKPEDFAFANKVADFYGVTTEAPKEDKNSRTNSYYKWSMVIRIPKDADPKEF